MKQTLLIADGDAELCDVSGRSLTKRGYELERDVLQATAPILSQNLEDLRLAERIERALCATGYESLRAIGVSVRARVVILRGRVPNYYMKQIAQETALVVPGTHQIDNGLEVVRPS